MKPGIAVMPLASIVVPPLVDGAPATTDTIRPPLTTIEPRSMTVASGPMMRALVIVRSCAAAGAPSVSSVASAAAYRVISGPRRQIIAISALFSAGIRTPAHGRAHDRRHGGAYARCRVHVLAVWCRGSDWSADRHFAATAGQDRQPVGPAVRGDLIVRRRGREAAGTVDRSAAVDWAVWLAIREAVLFKGQRRGGRQRMGGAD